MSQTKKALALEVLSSGLSVEKASEMAHVSRQCIYNWLSQESFKAELRKRQRILFQSLSKRLMSITEKALQVLDDCLSSRTEAVRLRASGIALSSLKNVMELADFEERLSELEEIIRSE
jgi:hypothetical protein